MKWMYLWSLFKDNSDSLFLFVYFVLNFPFLEREESSLSMERQGFCHKDIIALENGHLVAFLESRVSESCGFSPPKIRSL